MTFVIDRLQCVYAFDQTTSRIYSRLDKLDDAQVRGVIVARIKRLALGLMGDVEPVGEGVSELRIHLGAGWRIYFTQRGKEVIVLLAGGSKRTQKPNIKPAKNLASQLD